MSPTNEPKNAPRNALGPVVVLIPVKGFTQAKRRLSEALSTEARTVLAQRFANTVVDAAHDLPVAIVCDDPAVVHWARSRDLVVLHEAGQGLNPAVTSAVAQLRERGVERAVIVHSDLPLARDLRWLADEVGITLVPDHRHDGTNAMSLPLHPDVLDNFEFAYGEGSFARHERQALDITARFDIETRVVNDPELDHDVDVPADLDEILRPKDHHEHS
jgi:2-phospho-L-lactate/phosphoenolpyruvate guanylyltransferase